jgi:hypothetical protein
MAASTQNQRLYSASSPYFNTNIVNNNYLDVLAYRPLPMNPTDVYMQITAVYEYRPDLLAFDLYQNASLWWVFAVRNPNLLGPDPYFNFTAGTGIYVPPLSTLKTVLGI